MYEPHPDDVMEILGRLTDRQREVLRYVCNGKSYKQIALELGISVNSVKSHMQHIYLELNLENYGRSERLKLLHEVYCKGLRGEPIFKAAEPRDLAVWVPKEIVAMVDEDEPPGDALIYKLPGPTRRWGLIPLLLTVMVITAVATAVVISANTPSAEPTQVPTQVVQVTDTPEPTLEIVASEPPATDTPAPPALDDPTLPVTPQPTNPPLTRITLPFQDNFDNGLASPPWVVLSGAWVVSQGQLTSLESNTLVPLVIRIGDGSLKDYVAELDVQSIGTSALSLAFDDRFRLRAAISPFGGYQHWEDYKDNQWIGIASAYNRLGGLEHWRLEKTRNRYVVLVNGSIITEVVYGQPIAGPLTITVDSGVSIDNFKITN